MCNVRGLCSRNVVNFADKLQLKSSLFERFTHISDKPYPCGSTQNLNPYERRCWNLTLLSMEYFDKGGQI